MSLSTFAWTDEIFVVFTLTTGTVFLKSRISTLVIGFNVFYKKYVFKQTLLIKIA